MRSPPVNVYSESHQVQRRLQPVRRTNTHGRPACDDSPWMEWKISVMRIDRRIVNACFFKSLPAQQTRITMPARPPVRRGVVAGVGDRVIDAEGQAAADDVGLGEVEER